MLRDKPIRALASLALLTALGGGVLLAGPLDPPTGPVAPTYKTLTEVEPRTAISAANTPGDTTCIFRISQPGSYYLTADLAGVSGKNGITISASRVTIDFRGFHAVGVSGSGSGVLCTASSDVTLIDGSVSSWGTYGVDMSGSGTNTCRIARMTAFANAQGGFYLGNAVVADDCVASNNLGFGFISGPGTFNRCVAYFNTGAGFSGGFAVSYNACVAEQNNGAGFTTSALCNVTQCIAGFNGAAGITVNNGSTVTNCTALGNTGDGIACTFGAFILDNNCDQNGNAGGNGAGIRATGSDNRIEGNNCTQADRGIEVNSAGNIIVRNTCATNTTDWVLAANNAFGAIVDRRAPASAAVNGFTAASSLGSTDPWANFSY